MVSTKDIQDAFAALMAARQALYDGSEKELAAKAALKKKEASLLLAGSITGKNAETRDAQLKEGCQMEIATLEGAEAEKRHALKRHTCLSRHEIASHLQESLAVSRKSRDCGTS
jgi:hypothetical protein